MRRPTTTQDPGDAPNSPASSTEDVAKAVRIVMSSLSGCRRWRAAWIVDRSRATLSHVPPDALAAVIRSLLARNGWLWPLPGRMRRRALSHDLRVLAEQVKAIKDEQFVHETLLTAALPAPDGADRRRIGAAVAVQVIGAVVSFVVRHDPEWVLFAQSIALIISTACVSECEHVDARRWARFMTGAVSVNALLTVLVLISRSRP